LAKEKFDEDIFKKSSQSQLIRVSESMAYTAAPLKNIAKSSKPFIFNLPIFYFFSFRIGRYGTGKNK